MDASSWNDPQRVARFSNLDADRRLIKLLPTYRNPKTTRILDLGCAGGRNASLLADQGFDIHAIDSAEAMVTHTRQRLTESLGATEAARRVQLGTMVDLGHFSDRYFDLVVALGVYHCATSLADWRAAVSETSRVLKIGGRVLIAHFTPETDPTGEGVVPVPGETHLFTGFGGERHVLLTVEELESELGRHGLAPVVPSEVVRRESETGRRVTSNGFFERIAD